MKLRICLLSLLVAMLFVGCSGEGDIPVIQETIEKFNIAEKHYDAYTHTITDEGNIILLEMSSDLKLLDGEGNLIKEYPDTQDCVSILYDQVLYAYDMVKGKIISMHLDTGEKKELSKAFRVKEVLNMVKSNDSIYMLAIPTEGGKLDAGTNNYINQGEVLYQINLKSGKVKELKESNVIAIYGGTDGDLYLYAYRDENYGLWKYNQKKNKSVILKNMNEIGYLSAFVYERDLLIYASFMDQTMRCYDFTTQVEQDIDENVILLAGGDLGYVKGNITYYGIRTDQTDNRLRSVYIEDIINEMMELSNIDTIDQGEVEEETDSLKDINDISTEIKTETKTDTDIVIENKGTIRISIDNANMINPSVIKSQYGIRTKVIEKSLYDEAYLTEVMAGNPDVDIYFIPSNGNLADSLKDKGFYVPLNDSKIINEYKNKLHGYVADQMVTEEGDLWILPYSISVRTTWYHEDRMKEHKIKLEDLLDISKFMDVGKSLAQNGEFGAFVNYPSNLGSDLHKEYYHKNINLITGSIPYDTREFKDLFEAMWKGWEIYSPNPKHPYFRDIMEDYNEYDIITDYYENKMSSVIFISAMTEDMMSITNIQKGMLDDLDGWRVLPSPKLYQDEKNTVNLFGALINPYSENKELALEYLEGLTTEVFEFSGGESGVFLFKDEEMYEDYYDINTQAFQDVLSIIRNGVLVNEAFTINHENILDYQRGKLSLDEVVKKIEREAKMWLNE